ncbi:MAG: DUF6036 family nucleotidyltransferase [Nanoarchaeota archaeon]
MFTKEELNEWLTKVGSKAKEPVKVYMIGGCALSFKNLKEKTKDVDIIVDSKKDFTILDNAISSAGFKRKIDLENEFYLTALAVYTKGDDSRIDVFLKQVGKMLWLSEDMIKRAELFRNYDKLSIYLVSLEDIFLFKSMASRPGDIIDCDRIMRRGINYDILYGEMLNQSKDKKWFFWLYENICKLEDYSKIAFPIKDKIFALVKKHWKDRPSDFMSDISNLDKHLPGKKL